jgi:hypothetical protein
MDVKSAFLNGNLEEEVYVRQPLGFTVDRSGQVLALNKALYRLRQASWTLYAKLHMFVSSLSFMRSDHKRAVYTRRIASRPLVVGVYVDDLLIAEPVDDDNDNFKAKMPKCFRMRDLGLLTYYLGIEVCQDNTGILLCESSYARRPLEKTGMADCNPS